MPDVANELSQGNPKPNNDEAPFADADEFINCLALLR